ncbi:hypothetical protein BGI33_10320 [Snodgrassella alvi]|uniref:Uncharacterized protein n=1 Tax=Snodgrassella alvi TaxID=1196083 RepID=A0A2N9WSS1_9NEIS|nr:hypothetical protein BGI33_10320 [Snodgrassella alvi]PIT14190.1 hypothetical protein BGI32_08150 [Snodgrassella alvi]PIT17108.1 hypothetical protein BGI34_08790 [Snodgrassella alvi]
MSISAENGDGVSNIFSRPQKSTLHNNAHITPVSAIDMGNPAIPAHAKAIGNTYPSNIQPFENLSSGDNFVPINFKVISFCPYQQDTFSAVEQKF